MNKRICESCGELLAESFRKCPNCGRLLTPSNHTPPQISNNGTGTATSGAVLNIAPTTPVLGEFNQRTVLASFGDRALACLVDWIIVFFLAIVPMSFQTTINRIEGKSLTLTVIEWISSLIVSAIFIGYPTMLHSSEKQATFGKRLFGLKLSTDTGEKVRFGKALERSLLAAVLTTILALLATAIFLGIHFGTRKDFDLQSTYLMMFFIAVICLLPFSLALFTEKKKTLYDYICKTKVINVKNIVA
jgi:uncharacterized RDD family membrane protein YckC